MADHIVMHVRPLGHGYHFGCELVGGACVWFVERWDNRDFIARWKHVQEPGELDSTAARVVLNRSHFLEDYPEDHPDLDVLIGTVCERRNRESGRSDIMTMVARG